MSVVKAVDERGQSCVSEWSKLRMGVVKPVCEWSKLHVRGTELAYVATCVLQDVLYERAYGATRCLY